MVPGARICVDVVDLDTTLPIEEDATYSVWGYNDPDVRGIGDAVDTKGGPRGIGEAVDTKGGPRGIGDAVSTTSFRHLPEMSLWCLVDFMY